MDLVPGAIYVLDYTNWAGVRGLHRVRYRGVEWTICYLHSILPSAYLVFNVDTDFTRTRNEGFRRALFEQKHAKRYFLSTNIHSIQRDLSEHSREWEDTCG